MSGKPRLVTARLPFIPCWRDRLAWRLAGAALLIATPTYRALLREAYIGGLRVAIREAGDRPAHPTTTERTGR